MYGHRADVNPERLIPPEPPGGNNVLAAVGHRVGCANMRPRRPCGHTCDYPRLNVFILFLHRQPDDPAAVICLMTAIARIAISPASAPFRYWILRRHGRPCYSPADSEKLHAHFSPGSPNKKSSFLTAIILMLFPTLCKPYRDARLALIQTALSAK